MLSYNPYYAKYLSHHGIKGQEWGVKNGPPYPLDEGENRIKYDLRKNKKRRIEIDGDKKEYKELNKESNKKWHSIIKKNLLKTAVAIALIDSILMLGGLNPIVFPSLAKVLMAGVSGIKATMPFISKKVKNTAVRSITPAPKKGPSVRKTIEKLINTGKVAGVTGAGFAGSLKITSDLAGVELQDIRGL